MKESDRPSIRRVELYDDSGWVWELPIRSRAQFGVLQFFVVLFTAVLLALSVTIPYFIFVAILSSFFSRGKWAWLVLELWGLLGLFVAVSMLVMFFETENSNLAMASASAFVGTALLWIAAYFSYRKAMELLKSSQPEPTDLA